MPTVTSKDDIVFSTQGRAGTPDGNIFIDHTDPANPLIEILSSAEVPTVGGSPNPIDPNDGVTWRAIYGASVENRNDDNDERHFLRPTRGVFGFAGAYDLLNNHQLSTAVDLNLVRASGLRYLDATPQQNVNRIFFGPRSLGNVNPTSQPYYQTAFEGPSTDFARPGPVDELVQVFGTTAFGDAAAGDFDVRAFFALTVREWGFTHSRLNLASSGIDSAENFAGGFGLSEAEHPTTGDFVEADVFGGAAVAPFTGISFVDEGGAVVRSGFNEPDGDFSFTIENTQGANLNEVVAWMDAWARADGRDLAVLYDFDQGRIRPRDGLFIDGLSAEDRLRTAHRTDQGEPRTYPTVGTITVEISATAQSDLDAYYEAFILDDIDGDDYNTAEAITAQDLDGAPIVGVVNGSTAISWDFNFSTAPPATDIAANTPYVIRFIVGPGTPVENGDPVENFVDIPITGASGTFPLSNEVEQNI